MAISRAGRWAIATDGTFSLGYLTFPLLAGKLDIFSIGFCLEREEVISREIVPGIIRIASNPDREITREYSTIGGYIYIILCDQ